MPKWSVNPWNAPSCFYLNLVAKRNLYGSLRVLHVLSLQRFNCFCKHWAKPMQSWLFFFFPETVDFGMILSGLCRRYSLSKQLEWYSTRNLVLDFVNSVATQFMICIPPSGALFGSDGKLVKTLTPPWNKQQLQSSEPWRVLYPVWRQIEMQLQLQKSQRQANGHLSWCQWCILQDATCNH